jgi:integrase
MATIKFFTRSNVSTLAPVYMRFTNDRKANFIIRTPYRIPPQCWDAKKQVFNGKIIYTDGFTERDKVNIETKFVELKQAIFKESVDRPVTKQWLLDMVNNSYQKEPPSSPETLNGYIDRFIREAKDGKRLTDKKTRFSYSYTHSLTGFQAQFSVYQGIYTDEQLEELRERGETPRKKHVLNFDDINIDFYNEFIRFFYAKKYSPNTVGKHIKSLKTIMRTAKEEGLHGNVETLRRSFKSISAEVQTIYLTESEIQRMYELDLSAIPEYDLARDVFLIGCYTAQRFSDYSRINPENIRTMENGKRVIDLIQQKTGERVTIPIRHELETILKKYDYRLPKTYGQKVNVRIKDIAADAGITDMVAIELNKGGMRVKSKARKCDLVVTHTARRSGCTNMYLAGISPIDIMKVSGHKSEREFLKYIRVSKEETAVNLSNHPYFVGNPLKIAR